MWVFAMIPSLAHRGGKSGPAFWDWLTVAALAVCAGMANATDPFEVASVIHDAITTDEHRLRYPVSWGGAELAELHDRIDDSDWIAMGAIEEDAAYYQRFHDVFGLDLR